VQRLTVLLAAWVPVLVIPSALGAAGVFGEPDATPGWAVGVWIGGYLVQFALWMVIAKLARATTRATWWIVVSLLPWIVYAIPVAQPWLLAPCTVAILAFAWWVRRVSAGAEDLQEHGVRALGTVLEVVEPRFFNTVVNNVYIKRTLRLRIDREDGVAAYEARFKSLWELGTVPDPGDRMRMRVDPKHPNHIAREEPSRQHRSISFEDAAP
jgi:hypothetical protein